ncbi:hypothetical protein RSOLAG1IB_12043 [Rhizoctonia solani AG-1 IB]|uniref:Uncharacterized protein n=1 Tax=Thanatephorus cucumeris (strain AG1-IB / isolate 7/3/14) TaxID=1108050 RepID=A0A0B7FH48_THACB|nr:hypothetical protein RSOLAG1IB_12043 [Rhizoctonia solani AG-1 IB]
MGYHKFRFIKTNNKDNELESLYVRVEVILLEAARSGATDLASLYVFQHDLAQRSFTNSAIQYYGSLADPFVIADYNSTYVSRSSQAGE